MGERTVRKLAPDDALGALRSINTAFLQASETNEDAATWLQDHWDFDRAWGAFEEGEVCGTARTFASRLRLPGLRDVPVSCLTSVTVLPTHTRRGHLNRMMRAHLDAAVDAGEVASLLVAAEWPIYGRYGYGPYCDFVEWEVDTAVAEVPGEPVGSLRLVGVEELDKAAAIVLERHQAVTPGCIERPELYRNLASGLLPRPWEKKEGRVNVVHHGVDGEPDAFARYDPKERWNGMRPQNRLEVADLVAATPEAERELWRYLVDVDLVDVVSWSGPTTSAVRYAFADARAARQKGRWDFIWARILDVPACLSARSYAVVDRLVLDVVDGFMDRGGRFVLDAGPSGATCERAATAPADLTLDIATLGAGWLGGTDLRELAPGGGRWAVDEYTPGALDRLAALLRWHQSPACATDF